VVPERWEKGVGNHYEVCFRDGLYKKANQVDSNNA
jgi:hypothetical protein